jgi:UDP-glucose 4-epimerase
MKILVTGSAGHLGEALVRTLQSLNHEVIGLDLIYSGFTSQIGSIANRDQVKRCMKEVEIVLHCARLPESWK